MTTPPKSPAILLLCESENAANLDRRALREAGYSNVRLMTSGIEAGKLLADIIHSPGAFEPDIVVCQRQLEDMDGEQFCAIIRQHPLLLGLPILLILSSANEADQLRALGCGASALLGRPYSIDALKKQLVQLERGIAGQRQIRRGAQQTDTSAFDEALATYGVLLRAERSPEDYFKLGIRCFGERRWDIAIQAFERGLTDAQLKAEAELGLAAAYKGKGDLTRAKAWLARASESFVAAQRWNRARSAYARLLQHDPSARNPFLVEAHRLIRLHEYERAANVLIESLNLVPKAKAGDRYARICMAADEPEAMFAALAAGLEEEGNNAFLAKEIRASLTSMEEQREQRMRQQAAERKWQLSQAMQKEQAAKVPMPPAPEAIKRQAKLANAIEALESARSPQAPPLDDWDLAEGEETVSEAITPFGQKDSDDLFAKKGFLNELFSMIKLTWRLDKKSKKRKS